MNLSRPINTKTADGRKVALIFAAAEARCGLSVCCVCGEWLGLKRGLPVGEVSHGYCPACFAAALKEIEALPAVDGSQSNQATDAPAPSVRRLSFPSAAEPALVFPSLIGLRGFGAASPARLPVAFSEVESFKLSVERKETHVA
jgi:hypothetical protein